MKTRYKKSLFFISLLCFLILSLSFVSASDLDLNDNLSIDDSAAISENLNDNFIEESDYGQNLNGFDDLGSSSFGSSEYLDESGSSEGSSEYLESLVLQIVQ